MTVIVWDGKTLAADRQGSHGGTRVTVRKVLRIESRDGSITLVGGAGHSGEIRAWIAWMKEGAPAESRPKFSTDTGTTCLAIDRDGDRYRIRMYDHTQFPIEILEERWAIGSGRGEALGAMEMGANAKRAVEAAIRWDTDCGGGIDTVQFNPGGLCTP